MVQTPYLPATASANVRVTTRPFTEPALTHTPQSPVNL